MHRDDGDPGGDERLHGGGSSSSYATRGAKPASA
jgi:hypothetical protein